MIDLLRHTPATPVSIPAQQLQSTLNSYEQDLLTGIVKVERAAAATTLLLFIEGIVPAAYSVTGETRKRVSPSDLAALPPEESITLRVLALPTEGVQAVRMLLEWCPPAEKVTGETSVIWEQIGRWAALEAASVIHVTWPDAEGFVTLTGGTAPNEAFMITATQVTSGPAGLAAAKSHSKNPCTLARHTATADDSAEEKITLLHTAFDSLVDAVVQRYAELVGSHLAETLMSDLNAQARANQWEIKIAGTGIVDTHAFRKPEAAAQVYRSLLAGLVEHTSAVIGRRLANLLVLEAGVQLSTGSQQAIQTYSLIPAKDMRHELYQKSI